MDAPQQLPHLVVQEPKRSGVGLAAIIVVSLMLLAIPIGVYLVGEPQKYFSKASNEKIQSPVTTIVLQADKSSISVGDEFNLNVTIKSDIERVNLAYARLKFDPNSLAVLQVLPDGQIVSDGFAKEWVSKGFSNQKGEVILLGGVGSPGVVTSPGVEGIKFAQIRLVAVKEGPTTVSFDDAGLYKNSDNSNILMNKNNFTLNAGPGQNLEQLSQKLNQLRLDNDQGRDEIINITKPQTGEVYFYFKPFDITWSNNFEMVKTVDLYLNGEFFANIGSNIPGQGKLTWTPASVIPVMYITDNNYFQIGIIGTTKEGKEIASVSKPSFGLITKPDGKIVSASTDQIKQGINVSIQDASKILSRLGSKLDKDNPLDLNSDFVLSSLDLQLLKKELFVKDLVLY